jgi:hypothetical protein
MKTMRVSFYVLKVCKSMHHHTIQIITNQMQQFFFYEISWGTILGMGRWHCQVPVGLQPTIMPMALFLMASTPLSRKITRQA